MCKFLASFSLKSSSKRQFFPFGSAAASPKFSFMRLADFQWKTLILGLHCPRTQWASSGDKEAKALMQHSRCDKGEIWRRKDKPQKKTKLLAVVNSGPYYSPDAQALFITTFVVEFAERQQTPACFFVSILATVTRRDNVGQCPANREHFSQKKPKLFLLFVMECNYTVVTYNYTIITYILVQSLTKHKSIASWNYTVITHILLQSWTKYKSIYVQKTDIDK